MALGNPRHFFGVHSWTPYNRTTGVPYGIVKVLQGASLSLTGELVKLTGGSNRYPWAIEDGLVTAEMSCKVSEYPDFLFELFLGKAPTLNAAETSGSVGTITNKYGTSVVNASTGIASAAVIATTGPANLKFTRFLVKAVSATTVDIYALSDVDFLRGTDGSYTGNALKVLAAQSVTSGMDTSFATYGFKIAGGSGTIGMTTGDTAYIDIRPINTESMDVQIGNTGSTNAEFGAIVMAQKRGDGSMLEIDLFRCKGAGLPLGFDAFKFSEAEIKVEAFYDSTQDGVFKLRHVIAS